MSTIRVIVLARAYGVSPTWLLTGIGPEEWDAERWGEGSAEQFAAEVRNVARWMIDRADAGDLAAPVVTEEELPPVDEREDGEEGGEGEDKDDDRDLG